MNSTVCNNENNYVRLTGVLVTPFAYSHINHDKEFWKATLGVKRLSGVEDLIPIVMEKKYLEDITLCEGAVLKIRGILRTHFKPSKYKSIELYVLGYEVTAISGEFEYENEVYLRAKMSKYAKPILRFTPFGRQIITFTLQQENRNCKHTFNFSCIAWGSSARRIANVEAERILTIRGRFQSRVYEKRIDNMNSIFIQTHEISVNKIENIV